MDRRTCFWLKFVRVLSQEFHLRHISAKITTGSLVPADVNVVLEWHENQKDTLKSAMKNRAWPVQIGYVYTVSPADKYQEEECRNVNWGRTHRIYRLLNPRFLLFQSHFVWPHTMHRPLMCSSKMGIALFGNSGEEHLINDLMLEEVFHTFVGNMIIIIKTVQGHDWVFCLFKGVPECQWGVFMWHYSEQISLSVTGQGRHIVGGSKFWCWFNTHTCSWCF